MRLTEFKDEHAKLVGKKYSELSASERQTLYSMEIYNDSHDALVACDLYATTSLPVDLVDDQLRNTFGYTDDTIVE